LFGLLHQKSRLFASTADDTSSNNSSSNSKENMMDEDNNEKPLTTALPQFINASETGEIPSFNGDEKAKATDFANYFCSYAQLYHQKQMLVDHNRMAAYHSAIMGNANVFKDKVVMDVGTGSGILAVWAAQAGARRVYAVEYTDMAKYAKKIMEKNNVADIVTVIQGAVEDVVLPAEDFPDLTEAERADPTECVDIIISEWMGYFLLRESMLDSLIRARDKFLKPSTGLMLPSHTTMFFAPVHDEEERKVSVSEYTRTMGEWNEFVETTSSTYGVDMSVLGEDFDREQKEYYLLSSRWSELMPDAIIAPATIVKSLDMATCTIAQARGIAMGDEGSRFEFNVIGPDRSPGGAPVNNWSIDGPISGFAGWFTADFKSRTDEFARDTAPAIENPAVLSTGPENGYTHWGQQVFHLPSSIPLIAGETTLLEGDVEMMRSKENSRLYNCRISFTSTRRKSTEKVGGRILMKGGKIEHVYQIP